MRTIHHLFAPIRDLGPFLGDIWKEKLQAVRIRELFPRMLHHGFTRNKLMDGAHRILLVRRPTRNSHRLLQLLRIGIIETPIAELRPVQNASEGLGGYLDLLSKPRGLQRTIQGDEQGSRSHDHRDI